MAEGLFDPQQFPSPPLAADRLCAAMVRIVPRTMLVLDIAATAEEAAARARNEPAPDGGERWYRFFTPDDIARVDDPAFAMSMVSHEFAALVRRGATFPATSPLDGAGSGFAVSPSGLVVTNYHMVTSEVANHRRQQGVIAREDLCRTLRAHVAHRGADGQWRWLDAERVLLVSNPPEHDAIHETRPGRGELRLDVALLRVEPAPSAHLELSDRIVERDEPLVMAGFPLRSARDAAARTRCGYRDADGTLRVSSGRVTAVDRDQTFSSDLDGAMGSSGSPALDGDGRVVGLFSRATGIGARNAFEYGLVQRVHVATRAACQGLGLEAPG